MKKILVTIYVLSLQQEFDVFIPITMNMKDAISLIQDSIVKLSNENYQKKDKIINELENLYLKEYYDYNFTAFYDEIKKKENYIK